ncbi:phage tail protein [Citrobacter freundii]
MPINDFKPFAAGPGANVTSQADWENLPALLSGFMSGKASSAQINKAFRQVSFIAAALAQFVSEKTDQDVLDDGDLPGFVEKLTAGFAAQYLSRSDPFGDIASDGPEAIATALSNLHLEELPNFAKYGAPMIGELIEWPSDKMPNEIYPDMKMEFIPYIGQSFDPVKYPLLATLHPNLRLPADMRANVARGWDWGRGIDAGRVLMSAQDDAMQRITGELTDMCSGDSLQATGALTITAKPAQHWYAAATVSSAYLYYRAIGFDSASVARTANENRMKNVAWNMIVRAK